MMLATRAARRHPGGVRHVTYRDTFRPGNPPHLLALPAPTFWRGSARLQIGLEAIERRPREAFALGRVHAARSSRRMHALGHQDVLGVGHDRELVRQEIAQQRPVPRSPNSGTGSRAYTGTTTRR